jgi:hypothetical protein
MNNLNPNGEESDGENDTADEIDDTAHNDRIEELENETYGIVVETIILINQCNGSYQTIRNFIIDNNLTRDDYYVDKFDEMGVILNYLNSINNTELSPLLPNNNILDFNIGLEMTMMYTLQQARGGRTAARSAKMDVSELIIQFNGILHDLNLRNEQIPTVGGRPQTNFKNSRIKRRVCVSVRQGA